MLSRGKGMFAYRKTHIYEYDKSRSAFLLACGKSTPENESPKNKNGLDDMGNSLNLESVREKLIEEFHFCGLLRNDDRFEARKRK